MQFKAVREIQATCEAVFEVVAHIDRYQEAMPHISSHEFLSDQTRGAGTVFRETRMMGKREHTTELKVTDYDPPSTVRLESHAGGTVWDSVYQITEGTDGVATVSLTMDACAKNPLAAMMNRLIRKMVQRGVDQDMDLLKQYLERDQ